MRAANLLSALLVTTTIVACGSDEPQLRSSASEDQGAGAQRAYRVATAHGVTVVLPAGWRRARESLTPTLVDPREVLSVATFPLRYRHTRCAHVAGAALLDVGPEDAFITLLERGLDPASRWSDFPPRPAHFGPALGGRSEAAACVPSARFTDHWFGFTDANRHFHVLVAFGPKASAAVRDHAWAILDHLRIDPRVRPDWRSAG
jgi:hypothetical protein